jgi:hypothetical protein
MRLVLRLHFTIVLCNGISVIRSIQGNLTYKVHGIVVPTAVYFLTLPH